MAVHQVALIGRQPVAEGTLAFQFAKPAGFSHRAGQSVLMRLTDPPETDAEGDARTFTIASAPCEPDLMIATRMRNSAFKHALGGASPGTRVSIDGPSGELVLHDDASRPAVMLAGGIGITPFRAMAVQAAHDRCPVRMHLFYSNRRPEDAAFLAELQTLQYSNSNYRLIATMTQAQTSAHPWLGERGFIGREMLERYLPDPRAAIYYVAGPPAMTAAMQQMLAALGLDEEAVRSEEFFGY